MARFLPTIDATDNGTYTAIINGRLKLQAGQWIKFSKNKPSRFVGITSSKTLWAVHPSGNINPRNCTVNKNRFSRLCEAFRSRTSLQRR